jgi:hypothetical protein
VVSIARCISPIGRSPAAEEEEEDEEEEEEAAVVEVVVEEEAAEEGEGRPAARASTSSVSGSSVASSGDSFIMRRAFRTSRARLWRPAPATLSWRRGEAMPVVAPKQLDRTVS